MDPTINLVHEVLNYRGIERLLITLAGVVAIVLGGLLYKWGILDKTDMTVEGGKIGGKVILRNASPGILFCLLGVILLIWSLNQQITFKDDSSNVGKAVSDIHSSVQITYSQQEGEGVEQFLRKLAFYEGMPTQNAFDNIKQQAKAHLDELQNRKTRTKDATR